MKHYDPDPLLVILYTQTTPGLLCCVFSRLFGRQSKMLVGGSLIMCCGDEHVTPSIIKYYIYQQYSILSCYDEEQLLCPLLYICIHNYGI